MGKLSDEQAAQLAELQALAEAPDDPELELYVKDENGRETRLTGSHAQKWLKNLGLGDDDRFLTAWGADEPFAIGQRRLAVAPAGHHLAAEVLAELLAPQGLAGGGVGGTSEGCSI